MLTVNYFLFNYIVHNNTNKNNAAIHFKFSLFEISTYVVHIYPQIKILYTFILREKYCFYLLRD